VTFAGLFATSVLGLSILAGFHRLLSRFGAPWYGWLIAQILLIGYLAKKEQEWIPEPERRRWWARRVFFGSLVLALVVAWLRPAQRVRTAPPATPPALAARHA
jgi:hypothetical protein